MPIFVTWKTLAQIAQTVEHVLGKDEVTGSIPVLGFLEFYTGGVGDGQGEI